MSTTNTTTAKRTTPVRTADGSTINVGTGAVDQTNGSRPLHTCNTCSREVVWVKSNRTGRYYLANVFTGQAGQRYYIAARFHNCAKTFAAEIDELAEFIAQYDACEPMDPELLARSSEGARKILDELAVKRVRAGERLAEIARLLER